MLDYANLDYQNIKICQSQVLLNTLERVITLKRRESLSSLACFYLRLLQLDSLAMSAAPKCIQFRVSVCIKTFILDYLSILIISNIFFKSKFRLER